MANHFTVTGTRMAQDHPEQMGPRSVPVPADSECSLAEIDLCLAARRRFHLPERKLQVVFELSDETLDRLIAGGELIAFIRILPVVALEHSAAGRIILPR